MKLFIDVFTLLHAYLNALCCAVHTSYVHMMAEVSEESMLGHDTVCEAGQDRRGGDICT